MTNPIVIVADDLTGAIDSAAPFAARGARVRIALHVDAIAEAADSDPEVLAVDTRSRHLSAALAAERVAAAWHALAPSSPALLIKKVDSRLQGQCAAEVARLLALSGRHMAMICPAVPGQQRSVAAGCLTGRGVALPIDVAARFTPVPCTCADAADDADLSTIAHAILADPDGIMAVGAGGLATALAESLFGPVRTSTTPPLALPMLIAIGSQDPITDSQIDQLQRDYPEVDRRIAADSTDVRLHQMPRDTQSDRARALTRFAQAMAGLAQAIDTRTLLCSGGDTAGAIMDALAVRQLAPEHEWCPGIPVARIVGRPELRLVTKSGGFGDADVLSRIVRHAQAGIRRNAA